MRLGSPVKGFGWVALTNLSSGLSVVYAFNAVDTGKQRPLVSVTQFFMRIHLVPSSLFTFHR
jgi:hypothetical protein